MIFDYPYRATAPEILDDLSLPIQDLSRNLEELEKVNQRLGAYRFLQKALMQLLREEKAQDWTLADLGCGGGDALRYLYDRGEHQSQIANWIGLDHNPRVLEFARTQSLGRTLEYREIDLLDPNADYAAEVGMFNLVLHHFDDEAVIQLLQRAADHCRFIIISDLHRNALAYHAFRLLSLAWRFSYISRHDGKLSVRKSFVRRDWEYILKRVPHREVRIQWHWSFRWNLILKT